MRLKIPYSRLLLIGLGVFFLLSSLFAAYTYRKYIIFHNLNQTNQQIQIPLLPPSLIEVLPENTSSQIKIPHLAEQQNVQLLALSANVEGEKGCLASISGTFADTLLFLNRLEKEFPREKISVLQLTCEETGALQSQIKIY